MNKRGLIEEVVIIRVFELVMVVLIFTVLYFNAKAVIEGKEKDQEYEAIDLSLAATMVSSAPGNLEINYNQHSDFLYSIKDKNIIVNYGLSDVKYPFAEFDKKIKINTKDGRVILNE